MNSLGLTLLILLCIFPFSSSKSTVQKLNLNHQVIVFGNELAYSISLDNNLIDDTIRTNAFRLGDGRAFLLKHAVIFDFAGFSINAVPFFAMPNSTHCKLYLRNGVLKFLAESGDLVDTLSMDAILDSFSVDVPRAKQMTQRTILKDYYKGVFSLNLVDLTFEQSCLITNRLHPILFKEALIIKLQFFSYTNTTIRRYFVEFVDYDATFLDLNVRIARFHLMDCYRISLNHEILEPNMISKAEQILITGTLQSVDEFMFMSFKCIKSIVLALKNTEEFWHSSADHKWLLSVNGRVEGDINTLLKQSNSMYLSFFLSKSARIVMKNEAASAYDYRNEDICLFRNFPHKHLVFGIITHLVDDNDIYYGTIDTCTMYFVQQFTTINSLVSNYFHANLTYKANLKSECNLGALMDNCHSLGQFQQHVYEHPFNPDDLTHTLKWIELLGPIITFPIVCFIGLITNTLILLTILLKRNEKYFGKCHTEEIRMFNYIVANASFNIIECSLSILTLASECLGTNSVYCSSIMKSDFVIYFKIFVVAYFGEVMKTCSLLTTLGFSIERYIITSKTEIFILRKLSEQKLKLILGIIFVLSLATSYCKIDEYQKGMFYHFNQDEFPGLNIKKYNTNEMNYPFFIYIYLFHYILNDFILLMLNLLIDLMLVRKIKRDINKKRRILFALFRSRAELDSTARKRQELDKAEANTNKLIIYSVLVYIICRVPELVIYIYFLMPLCDIYCMTTYAPLLVNISQYLYVVSYSTNIFFYFKFNKKFQQAFYNILF